jgi:2-polyprenyl-3-methyl-5-hydroxy-6-metoxy-1,4-benzoquinol methylase
MENKGAACDSVTEEVWSLKWESSEALQFLLDHIDLKSKTCIELGAGLGHVSRFLHDKGVNVVPTDGQEGAVETMQKKFGLARARLLRWDDATFDEAFDLVFGSDLAYEATSAMQLRSLAKRVRGLPTFCFVSAPLRKPFLELVSLLKGEFANVLCKRIEPPECEAALAVICCSERSDLMVQLEKLLLQHEKDATVVFSKEIPAAPPLPTE